MIPSQPDTTGALKIKGLFPQDTADYTSFTDQQKVDVSKDIEPKELDQETALVSSEGHEAVDVVREQELEGPSPQKIPELASATEQKIQTGETEIVLRESHETGEVVPSEAPETTDTTGELKIKEGLFPQDTADYTSFTDQQKVDVSKDIEPKELDQETALVPSEGHKAVDAVREAELEGPFPQEIPELASATEQKIQRGETEIVLRESHETGEVVPSEAPETTDSTGVLKIKEGLFPQDTADYTSFTDQQKVDVSKDIEPKELDQETALVPSEGHEAVDVARERELEGPFPQKIPELASAPEQKIQRGETEIVLRESHETGEVVPSEAPETTDSTGVLKIKEGLFPQDTADYTSFTDQQKVDVSKDIEPKELDQETALVPSEGHEAVDVARERELEGPSPQKIPELASATEQKIQTGETEIVLRESHETGEVVPSEAPETTDTTGELKIKEGLFPQDTADYTSFTDQQKVDVSKDIEPKELDQETALVPSEGHEAVDVARERELEGPFPQEIPELASATEQKIQTGETEIVLRESHETGEVVPSEAPETTDSTGVLKIKEGLFPQDTADYTSFTDQQKVDVSKDIEPKELDQETALVPSEGHEAVDVARERELEGPFPQKIPELASATEQKIQRGETEMVLRESHETGEVVPSEVPETTDTTGELKIKEGLFPQDSADYTSFTDQQKVDVSKDIEPKELDQETAVVPSEGHTAVDAVREAELEGRFPQKIPELASATEQDQQRGETEIVLRSSHETGEVIPSEVPETTDSTGALKIKGLFPQDTADYTSFTDQQKVDVSKDIEPKELDQETALVPSEGHKAVDAVREQELEGQFPQKIPELASATEQKIQGEETEIVLRESHETDEVVPSEVPETADSTGALKIKEGLFPQDTADYTSFTDQQKVDVSKDIEPKELDQETALVPSEGHEAVDAVREQELEGQFPQKIPELASATEQNIQRGETEIVLRESHETGEVVPSEVPETADSTGASKIKEGLFPQDTADYTSFTDQQKVDVSKDIEPRALDQETALVPSEGHEAVDAVKEAELEGPFPQKILELASAMEQKIQGGETEIVLRELHETDEVVPSEVPETADSTGASKIKEGLFPQDTADYTSFTDQQKVDVSKDIEPRALDQETALVPSEGHEAVDAVKEAELEGPFPQKIPELASAMEQKIQGGETEIVLRELHETGEVVPSEVPETADSTGAPKFKEGLFPQDTADYTSFTGQQKVDVSKDIEPRSLDQETALVPSEGHEAVDAVREAELEGPFSQKIPELASAMEQKLQGGETEIVLRESHETGEVVPSEVPETTDTTGELKIKEGLFPQDTADYTSFTDQQKVDVSKDIEPTALDQETALVPSEGHKAVDAVREAELEGPFLQKIPELASAMEQKIQGGEIEIVLRESHETGEVVPSEVPETTDSTGASKIKDGLFPQDTTDYTSFTDQQKVDVSKDIEPRALDQETVIVPSEGHEAVDAVREEELEGPFQQKFAETVDTSKGKDLSQLQIAGPASIKDEQKEGHAKELVLRQPELVSSEGAGMANVIRTEQLEEGLGPEIIEYMSTMEQQKGGEVRDIVPKVSRREVDAVPSEIAPRAFAEAERFPEIEKFPEVAAESTTKAGALTTTAPVQMTSVLTDEYSATEPGEAVLRVKVGLKSGAAVDYAAQFWDSEAIELQLTNTWTPEGGAVFSPEEMFSPCAGVGSDDSEVWKSPLLCRDAEEKEARIRDSVTTELQQGNIWTQEGGAMVAEKTASGSVVALHDTAGIVKGMKTPQNDNAVDYAAQFWDSEAIELQLTNMWTPEGGAVVVEDIPPDISVPPYPAALLALQEATSDQMEHDTFHEIPPVDSLGSPGKASVEENLLPPQSSEVPKPPVTQIILEPGYLAQSFEIEAFASPQAEPQKRVGEMEEERAESGAPEMSPDSQPALPVKEKSELEPGYAEKDTADATFGSVEAGSTTLGTLPEWISMPEHPQHTEREQDEAEDTLVSAEPVFKTEKQKHFQESEQLSSDFIGDRLDSQINEERGPLLSIRRTEKHSCEKTSERILKRYGDVQPMESVTAAHENFVIAETETQFFDGTRDSSTRNTTEKARTEDLCSQSKFATEVSFAELSGKNAIEETNASQPLYAEDLVTVDYIVRPFNAFDDIVTVPETSTTGGLSWKQLPNDDVAVHVESNKTHRSDSSYLDRETEESAKVSDDINFPDELHKCEAPKLHNNFTPQKTPSLRYFSALPDVECSSLCKASNYVQQLKPNAGNRSTELLPGTKKSDISIKIERTFERSSSLSAESDALVDKVLEALQKPSLRVSDCAFDQQSVAASVVLVTTGKSALSMLTLPEIVDKSPLKGESVTSEPEWTQKTYSLHDTKESLKDLSVDAIVVMPPRRMQADINFAGLTEENGGVPVATDAGKDSLTHKASSGQSDSAVETINVRGQQGLPGVDGTVFTEAQAQGIENKAFHAAECERLEASCPPSEKREHSEDIGGKPSGEHIRFAILAADDTSLSDEHPKLLSADFALQAEFLPLKVGTPSLKTPPVRPPLLEMSTFGASTAKLLGSVAYQYTRSHTEGQYPLTVQAEVPEEEYPDYPELSPRLSCSDTKPEDRRFYGAEIPFRAPSNEDDSPHFTIKQAEIPFVVAPSDDRDIDRILQRPRIDTEADSGTSRSAQSAFLDSTKIPYSNTKVGTGTAEVGKKTPKKRKLSFSDQVTVSGETFFEKRKPLGGFCVTSTAQVARSQYSKRRSGSSNEASGFPGRQGTCKNIPLAIVISEEEYSKSNCEEPAAVERKASAETTGAAQKWHDRARESATDDDLENYQPAISISAGVVNQYGEFSTITYSNNVPEDNTEATSATWTTENKIDGFKLPEYVDTLFADTRSQKNKAKLSLSTESLGFSSEHAANICATDDMLGERREVFTALENKTWDSSAQEDASTCVPGGTCSSGDVTTERKTSLSSVSVGYSHEPLPNDHNDSYSGNILDDLESLKALVAGTKARSQDSDSASEDKSRKNDFTTTLTSHSRATDNPIFQQYEQTMDADTTYVPAIVLRDDTFPVSFPGPTLTDSGAEASGEYDFPVVKRITCNSKDTTKQESALSPDAKSASSIEEAATKGDTTPEPKSTGRGAPAEVEIPQCGASESSTSDNESCLTLLKAADTNNKDDACDISREVPEVDDEPPKAVAHCEELRFHNFRMVVERVADMSAGSDTNIVYESFVPAQGRAVDVLGNVRCDAEFTVRAVDDYDVPAIMYDHWNEDGTTVAPTIKTFWTYSPHSFLMCVNENGTHCGIISAIVFEDEQAFCAANNVKCEFAEEGVRRKLWDALLNVQQGKNLFAVVPAEQVNAYNRQLGFYSSARGLILHGKLAADTNIAPLAQAPLPGDVEIVKFNKHMYGSLLSFDKSTLGFGRKRFWKLTLREGPISFRVALRGSERRVCGYAGLQNDVRGVPVVRWLVADDGQVALRLLHNLLAGSLTFRQRGAWMAVYARSHASAALLRHLDTSGFQPWMLVFNRREPFLQYKNIAVLTYI
ncbi:hypothetical protein V5799_006631 [Amblyomma americanum]|uniref:Uncharacterized protein n=1 Tax=Amblyomma americanum TaxID=6943 RepID=A0AAQ4DVU9_AMBAM